MIHLRTRRDPVLDAAKGFLIMLVILGHLLARTDPSESFATKSLITGIYAFHMPAFVFLAGITSKPRGMLKRCTQFLTLLVVFQVALFWFRHLLGSDASFSWYTPTWLLWFLLSMTFWTLLTPLIVKFPRTSLATSLVISLVAGMIDAVGYPLSLSRTLVFLPFFVVGLTHGKAVLAWASRLRLRGRTAVAAAAVVVFAFLLYWGPRHSWFYGSKGYDNLDVSDLSGIAHRLVLTFFAAVLTAGLLVLMPREPNLLNRFGERSLSIYLLHGFVVLLVGPYVLKIAKDNVFIAVGVLILLATGTAVWASMAWVHQIMGRIGSVLVPLVGKIGASTPAVEKAAAGPAAQDPLDVPPTSAGSTGQPAPPSTRGGDSATI